MCFEEKFMHLIKKENTINFQIVHGKMEFVEWPIKQVDWWNMECFKTVAQEFFNEHKMDSHIVIGKTVRNVELLLHLIRPEDKYSAIISDDHGNFTIKLVEDLGSYINITIEGSDIIPNLYAHLEKLLKNHNLIYGR